MDFVEEGNVDEGIVIDLKQKSRVYSEDIYDIKEDILKENFISLDKYYETEEGKKLNAILPERLWELYEIDGELYTVLCMGFGVSKTVFVWDTELAQKYDVHPEEWDGNIWSHEEELLKIYNGEKEEGAENLLMVKGLREYRENLPELTYVLWMDYPVVIKENTEDREAEFLLETPEYQAYINGVKSFFEKDIWR